MEIIRQAADPKCSSHLENSIKQVDFILDHKVFSHPLKGLFGLSGLKHDVDFVSVLQVIQNVHLFALFLTFVLPRVH